MENLLAIALALSAALSIYLWSRIHHWTHRALRAEAAVERISTALDKSGHARIERDADGSLSIVLRGSDGCCIPATV